MKWFHQDVVLIPDLEDGVAYTFFLSVLKNERFKFSPAGQKETSLAEALRKVTDLIRGTEIYAENADTSEKAKAQGDKNASLADKRLRISIRDSYFTLDSGNVLKEVKGHPLLRK